MHPEIETYQGVYNLRWSSRLHKGLQLLEQIDQVKCRDDVTYPNSNPDSYLAVLKALGVSPRQAIAFEDSPVGAAAARAAGVFCVPNSVTKGLDFPSADLLISTLAGIFLADLNRTATDQL